MSRREFFDSIFYGYGGQLALGSLLNPLSGISKGRIPNKTVSGSVQGPHFSPKVNRVIYLFQSGGPSQLETWDYKPKLRELHGQELPDSVRQGQRLTGMSAGQASFPMVGSHYDFSQYGKGGRWASELIPHTAKLADELCVIKIPAYRSHQPRSRYYLFSNGISDCWTSEHGLLGPLWPRIRQ